MKLKDILNESPVTMLGNKFLMKIDRNAMHVKRFSVHEDDPTTTGIYLGGFDILEDAIKYAKAYFETFKVTAAHGYNVHVIRQHDGKVMKQYSK